MEDKLELLEAYLDDRLNANEKQSLEAELETNPALAEELEKLKAIKAGIVEHNRVKIIHHFANLEKSAKGNANRGGFRILIKYGVAALILFSLGLAYVQFFGKQQSLEALYSANYQPYPNYLNPGTRGAISDQNNPIEIGMRAYETYNMPVAIENLKLVLKANPHNHAIRTYLGLALLENNQPSAAVVYLNTAYNAKDPEYGTVSGWYMALAWLKSGEIERCKVLLEDLKNSDDRYYAKKATKLLNDLSR